jgi:transcriptional regulator with XRE-family HTH domain
VVRPLVRLQAKPEARSLAKRKEDHVSETPGAKLQRIRHNLGLSLVDFGVALGYEGNDNTLKTLLREYERDKKPVRRTALRLAEMFDRYGVPDEYFEDDRPEGGTTQEDK